MSNSIASRGLLHRTGLIIMALVLSLAMVLSFSVSEAFAKDGAKLKNSKSAPLSYTLGEMKTGAFNVATPLDKAYSDGDKVHYYQFELSKAATIDMEMVSTSDVLSWTLEAGERSESGRTDYYDKSSNVYYTAMVIDLAPGIHTLKIDGTNCSSVAAYSFEILVATGWVQLANGKWQYYKNGKMFKSWQKVSSKWYYFNSSGYMATGWQQVSKKWYYLGSDGKMRTGWQKISKKWYYFGSDGKMRTGKVKIGKKYYTFNAKGQLK